MFDFDATLPLMALQFVILVFILNAIFYKPLNKVLDERADYIRGNEAEAREKLAKAEQLAKDYAKQLAVARRQAQETIATAQAEGKKIADEKIAQAQKEAQEKREKAAQEIEQERAEAMNALEQQVDALSRQILEKLLGPELVK